MDTVPEHLRCPICFEMPLGPVFQCKDGHVLCEDCYLQLRECPQCRVAFRKDLSEGIRNRRMEAMLDELRFPCPFREKGCKDTLNRVGLRGHIESCQFGSDVGKVVSSTAPAPSSSQAEGSSLQNTPCTRETRVFISKDTSSFPEAACQKCRDPIKKMHFHCLQCKDHSLCKKCFKRNDHKHLFALVHSTNQLSRLRATGEALISLEVNLPIWWNILVSNDPVTKQLLDQKWMDLGDKCSNPRCGKEGRIAFLCVECSPSNNHSHVQLCKSCGKGGFHQHHILAVTGLFRGKGREEVAKKFLIFCQHRRMVVIPEG